jgi:hypothetical protein
VQDPQHLASRRRRCGVELTVCWLKCGSGEVEDAWQFLLADEEDLSGARSHGHREDDVRLSHKIPAKA